MFVVWDAGLRYLGVFLELRNWDGVGVKLQGRLDKWRWLYTKISYRGQILVISSLVALSGIQSILLGFFWGTVYTGCLSVSFFVQRRGWSGTKTSGVQDCSLSSGFCPEVSRWTGESNPLDYWKDGLDCALFLVNGTKLDLTGLSSFYCGVFKASYPEQGFYRVMQEPVVLGA